MRPLLPLLAAALLLLPGGAARADSFLDRPAPELRVEKWVAGEAPPAWKSLKGQCALLELLDPDDIVSEGLVSRTVEIAAKAKERNLIVVSVAVGTGADEATARAFAERAKVTWNFAVDRKGETFFGAGSPTLPRYWFVVPDGTVVWEGSPAGFDDRTLETLVERARMWRSDEIARGARPAAEAFTRGKFGEAWRRARKALDEVAERTAAGHPVEEGLERDAKVVLEGVGATAEMRLKMAEDLRKDRWGLESLEMYESLEAAFRGSEWEARAREGAERLRVDKRAMWEAEGTKRMRSVLEKIRTLNKASIDKAIEGLEKVAAEFENSVTAERCRKEIARLGKFLRGRTGK